jgi:hypothetical protein
MNDCPFGNNHEPFTATEAKDALRNGYCPLCLHDFAYGLECIECGHMFYCAPFGVTAVIPMGEYHV